MIRNAKKSAVYDLLLIALSLFLFFYMLFFAKETVAAMLEGLSIGTLSVVPALFPFMVIAELLANSPTLSAFLKKRGSLFCALFSLPPVGMIPFFFGCLCGFPVGARATAQLLENKSITKKQAAKLLCFCNNTGPAFVIAGIGLGFLHSIQHGVLLYASQIIAALILGIVIRSKDDRVAPSEIAVPKSRSVADAIASSALAAVKIIGFIAFFSVISTLLGKCVKNGVLLCIMSSFLEIGGAVSRIADSAFPMLIKLLLCAFAISFSGISVHLQTHSVFSVFPIGRLKYFGFKLLHGILSVAITSLLLPLFL